VPDCPQVAKRFVFDRQRLCIGSMNFDKRSSELIPKWA